METYLDTDNTYKLRLLQEEPEKEPEPDENIDLDVTEDEDENPGKVYEPVEYEGTPSESKTGKFRFPTFPLYNGALHGIASLTNKRVLDTSLKAPTLML
jgi:hypothetical protein